MDLEETLKEITENVLTRLEADFSGIEVTEEENTYHINIQSEDASLLIGYHGDNIQALQHIVKALAWKKSNNEMYNILIDIDNYRKRQEENSENMAKRKIDQVRKTGRPQKLPPMSAYIRRKIHMLCMSPGYEDVETISEGQAENRHIVIRMKS